MSVRKGFTLLEMVLVITLIGIIISVALVVINPNSQIAKVRNSQRISDINTIYSAVEQYFTDNLTYPEGMTTTKKDVCNGSTVVENCIDLSGLVPTYLASVPIDPSGVAYQIYINSDNNRIGVEAAGSELGQSIALNLISTTTPSTPTPTPAVTATGGNITTINENGTWYKVHTFTTNGTFTVTNGGNVEYLIVGGGGGGGYNSGGGGGAGGLLTGTNSLASSSYSIEVGAGGAGATSINARGISGSNSSAFSLTAIGGGGGGSYYNSVSGANGGSGGGIGLRNVTADSSGIGTTGQGNNGGTTSTSGDWAAPGGGGGAGAVGGNGVSGGASGSGGVGLASSITGTSTFYAGGGGGGKTGSTGGSVVEGSGGNGGGGAGGTSTLYVANSATAGVNGINGLGGGGGGGAWSNQNGGNGGSGIVIIRYPTTAPPTPTATGGNITTINENGTWYKVHTFLTSGTFEVTTGGEVEYLVVGGGGGGGDNGGGGGGAGGFRTGTLSVNAGNISVVIGPGGNKDYPRRGTKGGDSIFGSITSAGGGGGGTRDGSEGTGGAGGSGGGGGGVDGPQSGGAGNTPSTSPSQGNSGGTNSGSQGNQSGAGGGGAGGVGMTGTPGGKAGNGGDGLASSISGVLTYYAGGGGGTGTSTGTAGNGGVGGGGAGGAAATPNTGGGGGGSGGGGGWSGGPGGSGIVIIRYPTTAPPAPTIVTNGLVLHLDAGDPASYPGTGTIWNDLSGNNNNGTLVNGVGYNTANGGSLVFDGGDDYAPIGSTGFPATGPVSLSAWAKTNTITGSYDFIVSYGNPGGGMSRFIGINNSTYLFGGYGNDVVVSNVPLNTWFNMVGIYDGTNASIYINGVLVSGPTAKSWSTATGNANIGRQTNGGEYWNGNISQVSIYNRALTEAEIQQNFNATKGRFGL